MKKHRNIIILVSVIAILAVIVAMLVFIPKRQAKFSLDPDNYGSGEIIITNIDELKQLIDSKASFALFVSQPSCQASSDLNQHLLDFIGYYPMKFYEISFSSLKDSDLIPDLQFYPSFVIFSKGKVIDFLNADDDADSDAYTSTKGFENWFAEYVIFDQDPSLVYDDSQEEDYEIDDDYSSSDDYEETILLE